MADVTRLQERRLGAGGQTRSPSPGLGHRLRPSKPTPGPFLRGSFRKIPHRGEMRMERALRELLGAFLLGPGKETAAVRHAGQWVRTLAAWSAGARPLHCAAIRVQAARPSLPRQSAFNNTPRRPCALGKPQVTSAEPWRRLSAGEEKVQSLSCWSTLSHLLML